jgi:muramidase (phage lysozyme)
MKKPLRDLRANKLPRKQSQLKNSQISSGRLLNRKFLRSIGIGFGCIISISLLSRCGQPSPPQIFDRPNIEATQSIETPQFLPLVMTDGDPYIRALMRMISSSESNDAQPYSLIYGGSHFDNFRHHPTQCIRIVNGPNIDKCSTAAGRYQMIDTTWMRLSKKYHPQRDCILFVFQCDYSFQPQYQDEVAHAWLSDETAWNMNIPELLKAGKLEQVRKRLSKTWTSLGYGVENNTMTPKLAGLYQQLLAEELGKSK